MSLDWRKKGESPHGHGDTITPYWKATANPRSSCCEATVLTAALPFVKYEWKTNNDFFPWNDHPQLQDTCILESGVTSYWKPAWLCTELLGYKQMVKHVFDHSSVQQRPHLWSASLRHFGVFCFHFYVCSGTKDVSSLRRAVQTSQHTHAVWPENSNCYRNILNPSNIKTYWILVNLKIFHFHNLS